MDFKKSLKDIAGKIKKSIDTAYHLKASPFRAGMAGKAYKALVASN